jgi:hypothetical protein
VSRQGSDQTFRPDGRITLKVTLLVLALTLVAIVLMYLQNS